MSLISEIYSSKVRNLNSFSLSLNFPYFEILSFEIPYISKYAKRKIKKIVIVAFKFTTSKKAVRQIINIKSVISFINGSIASAITNETSVKIFLDKLEVWLFLNQEKSNFKYFLNNKLEKYASIV